MNKKEAELLLTFDDSVARAVLESFEYKIFCCLRDVALKKYGDRLS